MHIFIKTCDDVWIFPMPNRIGRTYEQIFHLVKFNPLNERVVRLDKNVKKGNSGDNFWPFCSVDLSPLSSTLPDDLLNLE